MNTSDEEENTIAEVPRPPKKQPSKVQRVKKPKREGLPKRPMSAYNVFFKEERLRWLTKEGKNHDENHQNAGAKSKFLQMSDAIAANWKELKDRSKYAEIAREDNKRYRKEMEEFNESIIRSTRIGRAALDGTQLDSGLRTVSESPHPTFNASQGMQPSPPGLDQFQPLASGSVSDDTTIQQLQHAALLRQFEEQQSNNPLLMLMNLHQQQKFLSELQLDQQVRYHQNQMQLQALLNRLQGSEAGGQVTQQSLAHNLLSLLGNK